MAVNFVSKIHGYQRGGHYEIYCCKNCFVSWVEPDVINEVLYNKIYELAETVPGYSRYARLANELKKTNSPYDFLKLFEGNYFSVLDTVERYCSSIKPDPKIAEFGCGKGYLTYSLNQAGYDCNGFDLSSEAILFAKNNFGNYYHCIDITNSNNNSQLFDIIICMEVIEHLSNPLDVIRKLLDQLTPNGILVLSTPQKNIANKSIWDTELPPVHLWWFSKKSIEIIATKINAKLQFVDAYPFYQLTGQKYPDLNESSELRPSFFDEEFHLLIKSSDSRESGFKNFKKKLRKKIRVFFGASQTTINHVNDNAESIVFTLSKI